MIDIPLNKALVAVEFIPILAEGDNEFDNYGCDECAVKGYCPDFACSTRSRKDRKGVIFKLVDLPKEAVNG